MSAGRSKDKEQEHDANSSDEGVEDIDGTDTEQELEQSAIDMYYATAGRSKDKEQELEQSACSGVRFILDMLVQRNSSDLQFIFDEAKAAAERCARKLSSDDCAEERERKKPKREDECWLLTSRNLERASLRYRSEHGIESDRLEDTLAAMCSAGRWRLTEELQREIPQTFFDQFTAVCHGRTIYTAKFFAGLRRAAAY